MTVIVQKPEFNLREKLSELEFARLPYEKMPSGTVIQHVYNHNGGTSHLITTSGTFTDLSFSVSITPYFINSLMLIEWSALGQQPNTAVAGSAVTVYRDNNRDDNYDLDESNTTTGLFGINIHRATARKGGTSTRVDKWSAGCQVIASNDDFHEFMDICQSAREIHGNSFSYTLIESKDIA